MTQHMRLAVAIGLLATPFVRCSSRSPISQVPLPQYSLRDTAEWANMIYGGTRAVLHQDGAYVDTIDLAFGVQHVPGGRLFLPIRSYDIDNIDCAGDGVCSDFRSFTFYDGKTRVKLSELVPQLMTGLSSPSVIDSVLFFWTIDRHPQGGYTLWAVKHDFRGGLADSTYLYRDFLETDYPWYMRPPVEDDELIKFGTGLRFFWLTKDLEIVRDSSYAN